MRILYVNSICISLL